MGPFESSTTTPRALLEPKRKLTVSREKLYTYIGLAVTIVAAAALTHDFARTLLAHLRSGSALPVIQDLFFLAIVYYLFWGALLYVVCRLGYLNRLSAHQPASRAELETVYDCEHPRPLAILVPAYREEERVVRQTLMSAALMEYPERRVVLLIDDPPRPSDAAAAAALATMRELPLEIGELLRTQERKYAAELAAFEQRRACGSLKLAQETRRVGELYREVARWLEEQGAGFEVRDHTDAFFVERILLEPARAHRARAAEIAARGREVGGALSETELLREYRRLRALFAVRLESFERKRLVNLSHAPNKAMNLNSYIGLIGGNFRTVARADGLHLEECESSTAQLRMAHADYVITVDADSLLLNDYALRLINVMEQPENQRFAVVQTPYTAVPGSPVVLERTAGAQTDLQWIMGQGSTYYGATFWIGASALLRYKALDDICQVDYERGYSIKKYIRDWTLTEDSESTVDLIASGWQLYNYPDRLSYSATPPDFGALVIQRRRWANGSLLIVPKLLRYLVKAPGRARRLPEALLRVQYLTSTAGSNFGVLLLVVYPFQAMFSYWLPLATIPYFLLYGRDLVLSNYKWRDLPRLYALNLLLIPVNLGGVAKSIQQWWTGCPPVFARTPKVTGRTAAPQLYILMGVAIPVSACLIATWQLFVGHFGRAAFGYLSALAWVYAQVRFVGIRYAYHDLVAGVAMRRRLAPGGASGQPVLTPSMANADTVGAIPRSSRWRLVDERALARKAS